MKTTLISLIVIPVYIKLVYEMFYAVEYSVVYWLCCAGCLLIAIPYGRFLLKSGEKEIEQNELSAYDKMFYTNLVKMNRKKKKK